MNRFQRNPLPATVRTYEYVMDLRTKAYASGDERMEVLTDAFLGADKTGLKPRETPATIEAFFAAKR